MYEPLTSHQLLQNSYHLSIHSSLLAIQSTLSLQQTMLRSDHSTSADIKSAIASQNANLQRFTKIIVETFSKISSFQPPLTPPMLLNAAVTPSPPLTSANAAPSLNSYPSSLPLVVLLQSSLKSTLSAFGSTTLNVHRSPPPLLQLLTVRSPPPPMLTASNTQQIVTTTSLSVTANPRSPLSAPTTGSTTPSFPLNCIEPDLVSPTPTLIPPPPTSQHDKVRSSATEYEWFQSNFCSIQMKNTIVEMIVYDDTAHKPFDQMDEKQIANQVEELLDKAYRFSESMEDKFKLVSCNFLTIGLANSMLVDNARCVIGEITVTWSMFVTYIFDPGDKI